MSLIGQNARKASLDKVNSRTKNKILKRYAFLLGKEKKSILKANQKDIQFALGKGLKNNLIERLTIDEKKLIDIKNSIDKIAKLKNLKLYEVGISYYGRTYEEGKKIGLKDAFRAFYCILKYNLFK